MTDNATPPIPPSTPGHQRKLYRSTNNRMIAGVVGGLAEYLNVDATAARVAFVAASVLLMGVGGPLLYILAWAIVPEYGKETSIVSEALRDKPWQNWRPAQGV